MKTVYTAESVAMAFHWDEIIAYIIIFTQGLIYQQPWILGIVAGVICGVFGGMAMMSVKEKTK